MNSLGFYLILEAQPTMALIVTVECLGHHGVSKSKEGCVIATCIAQRQGAVQVLIVQHGLHTLPRDVSAAQSGSSEASKQACINICSTVVGLLTELDWL